MEEQKYSRIGIASFITSIVSGILMFLLIVIAGVVEVSTPGGIDEESVAAIMIGLCFFAFLFTSFVALGCGIAGVLQKERKKVFAILGTVFSALTIIVPISLMMLGLAAG